jgi:hypothetical protein
MSLFYISFWFEWVPFVSFRYLPGASWFNGGRYWKLSFYWLRFILEISGPKKDKKTYKQVTPEELDKILKDINI